MIQSPRKLQNSRTTGQLIIYWPSGETHKINYKQLRSACRCASCRADQSGGKIALIPEDLFVEKINNLGQGLQLIFSDGHERGIFPWQYLFDIGKQVTDAPG